MAGRVLAERAPGVHVSLSHQLASVTGEYERTATAVVNAFVAPTVEAYLRRLNEQLTSLGLAAPLLILQASGGVRTAEDTVPVHTIESGPAAGMVAIGALSKVVGQPNIIATDVGGTTFKVGLLADGAWQVARETIINQYSLIVPMIDLVSIGAGGGSIAWADAGRLRIGPRSAGSSPRAGLLRLGRHRADRDRRRPGAGFPRRRQLPVRLAAPARGPGRKGDPAARSGAALRWRRDRRRGRHPAGRQRPDG